MTTQSAQTAKNDWEAHWRISTLDLHSQTPEHLYEEVRVLAQAAPYMDAVDHANSLRLFRQSPAAYDPSVAAHWVEGVFHFGAHHPKVLEVLEDYVADPNAVPSAKILAHRLLSEMVHEVALRRAGPVEGAGQKVESGAIQLPEALYFPTPVADSPLSLDAITLDAQDLRHFIDGLDGVAASLAGTGVAPIVATDLDGTQWSGDIGEALLNDALGSSGLLPQAAQYLARACEVYGFRPKGEPNRDAITLRDAFDSGALLDRGASRGMTAAEVTQHFYEVSVCAFAGQSIAAMKRRTRNLFDHQGFAEKIFPRTREILDTGRDHGFLPYGISASNQWAVEVAGEYLGIPSWRCRGIVASHRHGQILAQVIQPVTFGRGKVDAIESLTGSRRPALALGDSVQLTDREMLGAAVVSVAVEPHERHLAHVLERVAAGGNWRLLRFS